MPTVCPRCGQANSNAGPCVRCGEPGAGATFDPERRDGPTIGEGATIDGTIGEAATMGNAEPSQPGAHGPLTVGQRFGPRYRITRLLGAGGMGTVYQAWDAELGVSVALKVISSDSRQPVPRGVEERFKHELLLARAVTHKNVVRIHDLGTIEAIKYITMSYVEGDDLANVLRREGALPIPRALRLARQIADGLQAAHDAGIVHRDLKPANIMISPDDTALIMDFGISASAEQAGASGGIIGTLEYMAPEQGKGQAVDARADVYAFGLILHEMLVGPRSTPDSPQARIASMQQRSEQGVAPLETFDKGIAGPLAALVRRCLERDPAARYQTTGELCAALAALDDAGELIPIARRITKRMVGVAAVLAALLLGGSFFVGRQAAPVAAPALELVSVLITDFENRSGDPAFEGAVEQTLAIALETASYVTVFKTQDARTIAAQLKLGEGNRMTEDVGQLIARREGIKMLIAGSIDRQGSGYRLELRASDPATGTQIATAGQNVRDKAQVMAALALMATSVRAALGESTAEMAKAAARETMTAGSLDAMRAYARAQDLVMANQFQEALQEYQRAVTLDPQFGRAYAGIAVVYATYLKQPDKAEANYKVALNHLDRMTDREKYRTLGTYYLNVARNYEKAAENYETLLKLYPADNVGHGSLALAYLLMADVPRAVVEGRKSLEIYPRSSLLRYNYAMYAMYAGDFSTAITESSRLEKENPAFEYAWLPHALSELAQGDRAAAQDAYTRMSEVSTFGASFAKQGTADLEMYRGRYADAARVLQEGLALDAKSKNTAEGVPQKYVALAEAYLALGQRARAAEAAREATKLSRHESTLFPSARVLLRAEKEEQALQIATDLENMLQRQTTAYGGLIRGEIAMQHGRLAEGIETLREAQKRHDSWFSRFLLGKAYVEAGHFAEALAELDLCIKRRGETADVFFYDIPTLHYLPAAYYWLGRAQEGVGSKANATKSFEQFLALRADAKPADPLAVDARQRLGF